MISFCKIFYVSFIELLVLLYFLYRYFIGSDTENSDKEYDRRTSVERSNKREKEDYKLEDGRHRSSMMWYCRLYCTMMLQHLDAWEMPSIEAFQSLLSLDA